MNMAYTMCISVNKLWHTVYIRELIISQECTYHPLNFYCNLFCVVNVTVNILLFLKSNLKSLFLYDTYSTVCVCSLLNVVMLNTFVY